jgi:hypothetical protein
MPYCTACNALRAPFAHKSVNLAGKPSQVGGIAAQAMGWLVLAGGLTVALVLALIAGWLFTPFTAAMVGLPIAIIVLVMGILLLRGGRSLSRSGDDRARLTRSEAVFALAQHRGGILSAEDVATVLGDSVEDADNLLTHLAKTQPEVVTLDVDDSGAITYRFPNALARPQGDAKRVRVAPPVTPRAAEPREVDVELIDEPRAARR